MNRKPLRLWPGVVVVAIQCAIAFGLPLIVPGQGGLAMLAGVAGALLVTLWWLFFSRASWAERLGAILLMVVCVAVTRRLVHESLRNGLMGFMVYVYAAPLLSLALVAGAAASRGASAGRRRSTLAAAIIVACLTLTVVRTNGITGDAESDFEWRWTKTAEERLLAAPMERRAKPRACRGSDTSSRTSRSEAIGSGAGEGARHQCGRRAANGNRRMARLSWSCA